MTGAILIVNTGSSSIKFSTFTSSDSGAPTLLFKGQVEGIGVRPRLVARDAGGNTLIDRDYDRTEVSGHDTAMGIVASWLRATPIRGQLLAVGHRVAHGGTDFTEPVLIDDHVIDRLDRLVPLAPLHQPVNLAGIQHAASRAHRQAIQRREAHRTVETAPGL